MVVCKAARYEETQSHALLRKQGFFFELPPLVAGRVLERPAEVPTAGVFALGYQLVLLNSVIE
jgi:hypothetical protein